MGKITEKNRCQTDNQVEDNPQKASKNLANIERYYNEVTNALLRSNKRDERESNASHLM